MDARIGTSQNLPALTVTGKRREAGMPTLDLGGGRIVVLGWQTDAQTAAALDVLRADLAAEATPPKPARRAARPTVEAEHPVEGSDDEPETDRS